MQRALILSFMLTLWSNSTISQGNGITVSGIVKDKTTNTPLPFVTAALVRSNDSTFITGTITNDRGLFKLTGIPAGDYSVRVAYVGYLDKQLPLHVGRLSTFLDLGSILLEENPTDIDAVTVTGTRVEVSSRMDKKTYSMADNLSQVGGSVLQSMQNLPGVTVDREGKVFLRGSDKVTVLIDGKQTAITGMGSQSGLDNIPASAIESIEIINNPSSRHDASGMAGIINIIFKKDSQQGLNGRAGISLGLGALGLKQPSLDNVRDQYRLTPKINPSISANYKLSKTNIFIMADMLYHQQMMKNEFTLRTADNGEAVYQQFLENRTQPIYNIKGGVDITPNDRNTITVSGLFNYRAYTDLGDIPYDNPQASSRLRLWQYYENEVNQTLFATITHKHQFIQPGHSLVSSFNYSFRRKDEVFYFDNYLYNPNSLGTDTTMLVADENIFDLTIDYTKPLKAGRIEVGTKQRARLFPNNIMFKPGANSILDPTLAGSAEYNEWLTAIYGNYIWEKPKYEIEAGLRVEYAKVDYLVDPNHSVYSSAGFEYIDPFPSLRVAWLINEGSRLTFFYNRRVDRPEEKDLRTFPTYANPEILSMGNPNLLPQFTQSVELGYRLAWKGGYAYASAYHRLSSNILTKIVTEVPGSTRLAQINQNANKGLNSGVELVFSQQIAKSIKINMNANAYRNYIGAFTITSAYPTNITFSRGSQQAYTGNAKANVTVKLSKATDLQLTAIYLAPDIVPQGRILSRFSVDGGLTKRVQDGKGEVFINATDILNTLVVRYELEGSSFTLKSDDYYETQVVRFGYLYRF